MNRYYHPKHIIENYDHIGESTEITCILCGCEFLKSEVKFIGEVNINKNYKAKEFDCPRCGEKIDTSMTDVHKED